MRSGTPETFATADDGTRLHWYVFNTAGQQPRPAALVLHVGGFKAGNPGPAQAATDLASEGYFALACEYRLAPPGSLDGQRSRGYYPDQTNDVKLAVLAARSDPRCNGKVVIVGGSAGGCHALFCAATGTAGQDRPDAVAALSPITNMVDSAQYRNFRHDVTNYVNSTSNDKLLEASPINYFGPGSAPTLLIASQLEGVGGNPGMPPEQFADMAPFDGQPNFESYLRPNTAGHAFQYWNEQKSRVFTFLSARL